MSATENPQSQPERRGPQATFAEGDALQLAAETEVFLETVADYPLSDSAEQAWLQLRLAHDELVTKMLKVQRAPEPAESARRELQLAYQSVCNAKRTFLYRFRHRA